MPTPEKRSTLKLIFGQTPAFQAIGGKFVELTDIFATDPNKNTGNKFHAISHDDRERFTSSRFWKNLTSRFWQYDDFSFEGAAAASFLGNAHRFKIWFNPLETYKLFMLSALDIPAKFEEKAEKAEKKGKGKKGKEVALPTEKDIEQEKSEAEKQWDALIKGEHPKAKDLSANYGWNRDLHTELVKSKEQGGWTELGWMMWSDLIIRCDFINKNVTSVMIHEEQHILWNHLTRNGKRDPYQMNLAQDYAINQQLEWTPELRKMLICKENETFYQRFIISYVRFVLLNDSDLRPECEKKYGLKLVMVEGGSQEENIKAFIDKALPQLEALRNQYVLESGNHYWNRPDKTDGKSADFYYRVLQETMIFQGGDGEGEGEGEGKGKGKGKGNGGVRGYDAHDQWDRVAEEEDGGVDEGDEEGEGSGDEEGKGRGGDGDKDADLEGKECKGKAQGGKIDQTRGDPSKKKKAKKAGGDGSEAPLGGSRSKDRGKGEGAGFEHAGFDVTTACSRQEVKASVRDSMERSGINPDDPAEIERALKRIPGMNGALGTVIHEWFKVRAKDWRQILSKYITTAINIKDMDYTMSRENRRLPGVFPGKRRERGIDLIVAVDTSGSINYNDYNDFVNQIEKISKDCELNKVRLIQCHHTIAYDHEVILSRIKKLGIVETGGTTMRVVFEKLKRENNKKLLILFTDGVIDEFDPKEYGKFKHILFTSRGNRMYGENLQKRGFTVIMQDEE